MSISQFAQKINHPLCSYMDKIPFEKQNKEKSRIWFLSGDPTSYGATNLKMPQQGYQIIRKAIRDSSNHGYTDSKGTSNARKAVAKIMKTKIGITQNDIFINHGVNTGLLAVLMAFTNQGDQILVPEIGYPFFQDLCPAMNRKAVSYKLKRQSNFQIDLEHAKTLVNEKTQFLFVINPSNPMGTVFTKGHMQQILRFADQNELPIVSDEVYYGQSFPDTPFYSFGELTENVPVVLLSGMEKNFSVPGWSISWTVIIDKNGYIDQIKHNLAVISTVFLHPNKFVQQGLGELFDKVGFFINRQMGNIQKVHDGIYERLSKMNGLKPFKAQGTIYITVEIDLSVFKDINSDQQFVHKMLEQENINAFPLSAFGGNIHGLRLLTCATGQLYEQFYKRMECFLKVHYK